jgi:hypothetical protein
VDQLQLQLEDLKSDLQPRLLLMLLLGQLGQLSQDLDLRLLDLLKPGLVLKLVLKLVNEQLVEQLDQLVQDRPLLLDLLFHLVDQLALELTLLLVVYN